LSIKQKVITNEIVIYTDRKCSIVYEDQCQVRNETQSWLVHEEMSEEENEDVCSTEHVTEYKIVEETIIEQACDNLSKHKDVIENYNTERKMKFGSVCATEVIKKM
jgi:hypothetical protein